MKPLVLLSQLLAGTILIGIATSDDSCATQPHHCHVNATCVADATNGYYCQCGAGFYGNGTVCETLRKNRKKNFLFGGQSNMEGNFRGSRFRQLMDVLEDTTLKFTEKRVKMVKVLDQRPDEIDITPVAVLEREAEYLIGLWYMGLLSAIRDPAPGIDCSFYQGSNDKPQELFTVRANRSILSPFSNCGIPFGPELMFGHALRDYYDGDISITKVATGGTELAKHWSKQKGGAFWNQLREKIHEIDFTQNSWDAFVWWQGENDSLQMDGETYLKDLTEFVADVRQEMYLADKGYEHPEDIPVIIVQIGYWAQDLKTGLEIAKAQEDFVAADNNAALIRTYEFSWFFHHDDATQLIVGDQIALALYRDGMLKR